MPAQLLSLDGSPSILLDKPILLIGRHPECDIQIDSRKISRRHCCIAQVSDYLVVRDLASTNGIRINGERVLEGRLSAGDELILGDNRYEVRWDDVAAAVANALSPATARRPTALDPSPVTDAEDELLESCDEPVPLQEPQANAAVATPADASAPLSGDKSERPFVLPDELELLPKSDIFPNASPHPSGARPPS